MPEMERELIQSRQNQRVKNLVKLRDRGQRRKQESFIIEGFREVDRALKCGRSFECLYVCEAFFRDAVQAGELIARAEAVLTPICELSQDVFEKVSLREGPDGLLAVTKQWDTSPDRVLPKNASLLLVVEGVEKPGNLGALIRTAEGAGAHGLLVTDPVVDLFNPNVVRASQGLMSKFPVAVTDNDTAAQWLSDNKFQTVATTPDTKQLYWDCDLRGKTAMLLGAEADGLSKFWLERAQQKVKMPMQGIGDSLNVGIAAALVLYEALRQRR